MNRRPPTSRVITYIDAFNLYYGLKAAYRNKYLWLDITQLSRLLLKPWQTLSLVKYFTARISGPRPDDAPAVARAMRERKKRQDGYLDVLSTLHDLRIYEGHYLAKTRRCRACGASWTTAEEKMTDVSMATELLVDAFRDGFDTALIISGDSDLVPPIAAIREHFPEKRVVIAFPPRRHSAQLQRIANAHTYLNETSLRKAQLPDEVQGLGRPPFRRPPAWR